MDCSVFRVEGSVGNQVQPANTPLSVKDLFDLEEKHSNFGRL